MSKKRALSEREKQKLRKIRNMVIEIFASDDKAVKTLLRLYLSMLASFLKKNRRERRKAPNV